MKALTNLQALVPNYFKNFINTGRVELIQLMEFPEYFQVLTFDKENELYYVGAIYKSGDFEIDDEAQLFEEAEAITQEDFEEEMTPEFEYYTEFNTLEEYANYRFALSIGIEGL